MEDTRLADDALVDERVRQARVVVADVEAKAGNDADDGNFLDECALHRSTLVDSETAGRVSTVVATM